MGRRGQTTLATPRGKARASRAKARRKVQRTVRHVGRSRVYQSRWAGSTVLYVVGGRDAWSEYLTRAARRPGWSVAKLARESGIAKSSLFKWIARGASASITIDSVYRIADAIGDDRANALRAASNLPPERDPAVEAVLSASQWTELEKAAIIERMMRRRELDREREMQDLRFLLGEEDAAG